MQVSPHSVRSGGQTQVPETQVPPWQTRPQRPQLAGSVARLTHRSLHIVSGGRQVHRGGPVPWNPAQQMASGGHVMPHRPQLCGSRAKSTQMPSQSTRGGMPRRESPGGQAQTPFWQVFPPVQMVPQRPQLCGSTRCGTQEPWQQIVPGGQALPHVPQWLRSVLRLAHVSVQQRSPGRQHERVSLSMMSLPQTR
jgi:hypothetical protein